MAFLPFHFRSGLAKGTRLSVASLATVIATAAASGGLSLRLSVRFYDRRDL